MRYIPTMYSSREELILDLTIAGKVASSQPRSYDEMRDILFEEFKLNHPVPSLESKRYELSDKVSDDYEIGSEELKLGENEQIINLEEDGTFIDVPDYTKVIPVEVREAFTYENQITEELRKKYLDFGIEVFDSDNDNLGTVEQVRGLTDEEVDTIGTDAYKEEIEPVVNEHETRYEEDEGVSFSVEPELFKGVSDFDLDFELYVLQYDLGVIDFDYEFELVVKDYVSLDSIEEIDFPVEDEDLDSEDEDEYEFDSDDEDEYEFDSDDEEEYEDSEDEDEYEFDSDEDLEDEDEDEYEFDSDEDSEDEDEYEFDSDEEEEYEDLESEDEYDNEEDDYELNIGGATNSWFTGIDIEFDYEFEETFNEKVTVDKDELEDVVEDEFEDVDFSSDIIKDDIISEEKEEVFESEVSISKQEKELSGKSPPVEVEAVEEVLEDEPKDLRQFLRKHPRCDINLALKYFSKKEIEKAILIGKVVRRGNKLHI